VSEWLARTIEKNRMKTIAKFIWFGLVASALSMHEAQAAPINGTIGFAGSVRFDSSHLDNATQVLEWHDVFGNGPDLSNVAESSGDFVGFVNLSDQATMATLWIFNPSMFTPELWSVGGFTFDLDSATIVSQTPDFLNITGTGTISGNGFEDTPATWAFTVPDAGGNDEIFTFSAQSAAPATPTPTATPTATATPRPSPSPKPRPTPPPRP
jgi:hypothetical protein